MLFFYMRPAASSLSPLSSFRPFCSTQFKVLSASVLRETGVVCCFYSLEPKAHTYASAKKVQERGGQPPLHIPLIILVHHQRDGLPTQREWMSSPSSTGVATNDASVRQTSEAINNANLTEDAKGKIRTFTANRSDVKGLMQAVPHLLLAGLFSYLWHSANSVDRLPFAVRVVFLLCQALVMAFFFPGLHECVHFTAFKTRALNLIFGHIFAIATTRPFFHYTFYHFNHHKFTGDPARDPELQDSFIDMRLDRPITYLCYLSGVPFWIDRVTTLFRHAFLRWVLPREKLFLTLKTEWKMIREARWYVSFYVACTFWMITRPHDPWAQVMWYNWVVPSLLAQPCLRFYLIAEHTNCPQGDDMISNTRTTETYRWYRWLAWQMPYHAEHHAFPNAPFHQLADVHAVLKQIEADRQSSGARSRRQCDPDGTGGYWSVHTTLWKKWRGMR